MDTCLTEIKTLTDIADLILLPLDDMESLVKTVHREAEDILRDVLFIAEQDRTFQNTVVPLCKFFGKESSLNCLLIVNKAIAELPLQDSSLTKAAANHVKCLHDLKNSENIPCLVEKFFSCKDSKKETEILGIEHFMEQYQPNKDMD